jgi:hypothetical protein
MLIGAPELHHWHHDRDRDAGNYANISPLMDILFGTYRCPDHEPARFGLNEPPPATYPGHLIRPLLPRRRAWRYAAGGAAAVLLVAGLFCYSADAFPQVKRFRARYFSSSKSYQFDHSDFTPGQQRPLMSSSKVKVLALPLSPTDKDRQPAKETHTKTLTFTGTVEGELTLMPGSKVGAVFAPPPQRPRVVPTAPAK